MAVGGLRAAWQRLRLVPSPSGLPALIGLERATNADFGFRFLMVRFLVLDGGAIADTATQACTTQRRHRSASNAAARPR